MSGRAAGRARAPEGGEGGQGPVEWGPGRAVRAATRPGSCPSRAAGSAPWRGRGLGAPCPAALRACLPGASWAPRDVPGPEPGGACADAAQAAERPQPGVRWEARGVH